MSRPEGFKRTAPWTATAMSYRLWVNAARTTMVRLWNNGSVEIAARDHPDATWGPPIELIEEKT